MAETCQITIPLLSHLICLLLLWIVHVEYTNLLQFLGLRPPPKTSVSIRALYVAHSLVSLGSMLSDDIVLCCNPLCTSHQTLLDEISYELVTCLKSAADLTVPSAGTGRHPRVAGWSQFVKPELTASQWWHKLWVDAGSPSAGVLFQLMITHRRYKYAVHRVWRKEEYFKRTRLAEALLSDPNCNFWSKVRRFVGHHKSVPAPVVDGVSGPENIANLWCSNFKQLYNTLDGSASTDVLCALDSGISHDVLYQTSISAEVIEVAIGKSKRGKSDALRKKIADCEAFGQSHGLRFNTSRTQLICFRQTTCPVQCHFCFDGQS